ncbi:endo-1,4-beta-xylanase 5-like [Impatiens glandulifera]|uniref:endo-1,4-beta-xylanase 5-like n=1 Tax=Impatiens glandulifera TaxID=253017 RepID=UPI001FB09D59|nr:endo-1,4-beta-xylanase 5-like [Impatiens glandulifera]
MGNSVTLDIQGEGKVIRKKIKVLRSDKEGEYESPFAKLCAQHGIIHETTSTYSSKQMCLAKPLKPQYGGGIAVNTELDNGIEGWVAFEDSKIEYRVSSDDGNNKFIAAHQRTRAFHSPSQNFFLEKDKIYTFSAWLQVSSGNASIYAIFKSPSGYHKAGITVAQSGCWSMLKGGLSMNVSESAQLYFESDNTNTEIWVDSISLQPFTLDEWRSHIDQSVEKERKNHVKLRLVDVNGKPLANTHIKISLRVPQFQFGCASNSYILSNSAYRQWFASKRFTVTTFENEMKWYSTEPKFVGSWAQCLMGRPQVPGFVAQFTLRKTFLSSRR